MQVFDAAARAVMYAGFEDVNSTTLPAIDGADLVALDSNAWSTFGRIALADGPLSLSAQMTRAGVVGVPAMNSADTAAAAGSAALAALSSADGPVSIFSDMSLAQSVWAHFWAFCGSDQRTLLWFYLLMNVTAVVLSLVFMAVDFSHILATRKLQPEPERWPAVRHYWMCLKVLLFNYTIVILPMVYFAHPLFRFLQFRSDLELPSVTVALAQLAFFLWAEDFSHYWLHRGLHVKWLYPIVHKVHHEFSAPFGLAASYAHPIEVVVLGFCTFVGPMIIGPHYAVFYIWILYRDLDAVFTHCGYDVPGPTDLIPYYGGAPAHDLHHREFLCNFSSRFTYLDMLFGTYKDPELHRAKILQRFREKQKARISEHSNK